MKTILAANFKGMTQLPLFSRDPGYLKNLGNMRVKQNGYLEMRGGITRLKPVGGSAVNPTSTAGAGYMGVSDSSCPFGWVRLFNNAGFEFAGYRGNLALQSYIPAGTGLVGEKLIFGADRPFSSITLTLLATAGGTFAFEYGTADGAPPTYTALTVTTAFDFATAVPVTGEGRQTTMSWAMPTNWVPTTEGNGTDGFVYKYWVQIRRTGAGGALYLGHENVHSDWEGVKELYVAHGTPTASADNGILSRYSNNVTTASWFNISTALFSGNYCKYRFNSYRGVLYFVNGKNEKRYDGSTMYDMGLPTPTQTLTVVDAGAGPGTWTGLGATLQFRYAYTYGYGSQQIAVQREQVAGPLPGHKTRTFTPTLFGQSAPCAQTSVAYPAGADRITIADANSVAISIAVQPPQNVDAIYVYRTEDLTNVPASAVGSMPYYLTMTLLRSTSNLGQFVVAPTTSNEQQLEFPIPKLELDQTVTTPPPRTKNIWMHKNRLFLANSDRYPARVWWSRPFEPDRYYTDEDFEDFSTTIGGQVVGGTEFMNQSVVFTEDQMYGIADVDVDQFQSYPISPGVGCVAPDSICVGPGVLLWAARDGIYLWDGKGPLQKISHELDPTFQKMSIETHGWSRAIIHNDQYEIFLQARNGTIPTEGYRYDLITNTWSSVGYGVAPDIMPLATITAPLGTNDAGVRHPLLGQPPVSGSSNWNLYVGELGTSDDGSSIGPTASIHFGPPGAKLMSPDRAIFYYLAPNGWTNIQFFLSIPDVTQIGYDYVPADIVTSTSVGSGDYTVVQCLFKPRATGSQDIVLTFTADSVDGQTLWGQKLLAAFLEGDVVDMKRPA